MNKLQSEYAHAQWRAHERYGITLTKELHNTLRGKIKRQAAKFLYRRTLRVTIWEVEHEGETYKVAYDKIRHCIITFLPK